MLPNVRFGSKADMCGATGHVRFTPESGLMQCSNACLLWANSGHGLLNYFVGAGEKRRWQGQSERLGGFAVDQQSVFRRQHDR
jgi:hypothetical protein